MQSAGDISFEQVLHDELDAAATRRGDATLPKKEGTNAFARASQFELFGLTFSGGGIRSATFNLGVLQALHETNILKRVDYLSTVSGGGYIGSWFISWLKRNGNVPNLAGEVKDGVFKEPNAIRHLRRFSNYLTPKVGLMNADTWSIASMYVRNLLLNLIILLPLLMAALLVPHVLLSLVPLLDGLSTPTLSVIGYVMLIVACFGVGLNLVWKKSVIGPIDVMQRAASRTAKDAKKQTKIPTSFVIAIVCTLVAAWLAAHVLHRISWEDWHLPFGDGGSLGAWAAYGSVLFVLLWVLALLPFGASMLFRKKQTAPSETNSTPTQSTNAEATQPPTESVVEAFSGWKSVVFGGALAGPVCGLLFYCLFHYVLPLLDSDAMRFVFGMPIVLSALALVVTLQIGIAGSGLPDFAREWWSRFGGWLMICTLFWIAGTSVSFYSEKLVAQIPDWIGGMNITLAWVATTVTGLLAAKSGKTGDDRGSNKALNLFAKLTPVLFVIGIVTLTSNYVHKVSSNETIVLLGIIGCCLVVSLLFAWRVNVNVFSMNSMYYNRLTRCYLGASRDNRKVNPVIGFDEDDDEFGLYEFTEQYKYNGPFPLINTAVNLVKGKELSWQKRKASSFIFSPLYCGFRSGVKDCYGRAGEYPMKLGRAVSISGAAASPNMGYHSSAPLAFLMTVFNVRLGSWFPNPAVLKAEKGKWVHTDGPGWGLFYLIRELFGLTDETSSYVYLSDGGHFENLGLYELIRRRCKYIVVCDAAADPKFAFGDLGGAIEKCRADFGVEIHLNLHELRLDESKRSKKHFVIGEIHYPKISGTTNESNIGKLVYVKSTITGDERSDLLSYQKSNPEFPHQSTADQWFDESQFESYRELGYHSMKEVLESDVDFLQKDSDW